MAAAERDGWRWEGRYGRMGVSALLVAGTLVLYARVVRHGFLLYDDWTYVSDPHVRAGLTLRNLGWALTTLTFSNWHPLTWLSYMLDVELFGLQPGPMHLVNAALHAANGALLFLVLNRMTGARGRCAIVAALFAVHPLHVESVAWIAERKDVLSTLFGLAALAAYQRYAERQGAGRYAAVAASFAASLLAKPMLVTLPFVLLLLDFWPLRRISGLSPGDPDAPGGLPRASLARLALEKLPLLALATASSIITVVAQGRGGALQGLELPVGARVANALVSVVRYVGMSVWPAKLAIFYPHPREIPWPIAAGAVAAVAGTTALALSRARTWPWLAVGWCWFLGSLVPVIGIVQVGGQALADRYTYFPSIGLFLAAVWSAHALWPRRTSRLFGAAAWGAALAGLFILSWRQIGLWRDHETLFRHAIAVTERNGRVHAILAAGLRSSGRLGEALSEAREAVALDPASGAAWTTLGMVQADLGRPAEAQESFETAVQLAPRLALAWTSLGQAAAQLGELDEAERALARATSLAPANAAAWNELGLVLAARRRWVDALGAYRRAVAADPTAAPAWLNLASACTALGQTGEAREALEAAMRADPSSPAARRELDRFLRAHRGPAAPAGPIR